MGGPPMSFSRQQKHGRAARATSNLRAKRLHFIQLKEEPMARLSRNAKISAGIIVNRHGQMNPVLIILLDNGNCGDLPGEHHV
jgi:hypothetical protein